MLHLVFSVYISGGLQTYFSDCLSECRGFVVDLPLLYAQHVMHSYGDTYLSYEAAYLIVLARDHSYGLQSTKRPLYGKAGDI